MATIDKQIKMQMAARFKQFREEEGLSQDAIAEKTSTPRSNISKYDNGSYNLPIDFILDLKKYYRLSIDWLFTGEGSHKSEVVKNNTLVTDIKTLNDNNIYLHAELKSLKKEFYKMHADFYELKNTFKAG